MAVYELDSDLQNFDLHSLAESLKDLSRDLNKRTLGRVASDGALVILGEVAFDPNADALIVIPTAAGLAHWGQLLPGASAGLKSVLDDAEIAMAKLTGGKHIGKHNDPFCALDRADSGSSIWSAATASALRVKHYDQTKISRASLITEAQFPPLLKARQSPVHQHAVHEAYMVNPQDPDQLIPVIAKSVPGIATTNARKSAGLALCYEHAALKALARHGVPAAVSHLKRDGSGDVALVLSRFDRSAIAIQSVSAESVVVKNADLAKGPEVLSAGSLAARRGDDEPRDPFHYLQRLCGSKPKLAEAWMARRLFDVLIGNTDHQPNNAAVLWQPGASGPALSIAPSFDVTPYLFDNSAAAVKDSGLEGVVLGRLSLSDICKKDRMIHAWTEKYPDEARQAFAKASLIRDEMKSILRNELMDQGFVSHADVTAFDRYLSSPLGNDNHGFDIEVRSPEGSLNR